MAKVQIGKIKKSSRNLAFGFYSGELSFVFLPIRMLFPISTGAVQVHTVILPCAVHHKCPIFSSQVDHLQGMK